MSYTEEVRRILLWSDLKKKCCRLTELFVLLCAVCGVRTADDLVKIDENTVYPVKNGNVFSRIRFISSKLLGPEKTSEAAVEFRSGEGKDETLAIYFGIKPGLFKDLISEGRHAALSGLNVTAESPCCKAAALRSFFCVSGTVSSPDKPKNYVEIYFECEEDALCCRDLLASFYIRSGVSKRRNKFVCYVKNAEGVSDFLTVAGAPSESIRFQVEKTGREVRNNVNRVMNCDLANIEKVRRTAEKELEAIDSLKRRGLFYSLPDDVRDLCRFRIANPDATHGELGSLLTPGVSGSAVSRKMKQMLETAGTSK